MCMFLCMCVYVFVCVCCVCVCVGYLIGNQADPVAMQLCILPLVSHKHGGALGIIDCIVPPMILFGLWFDVSD